MIIRYSMDNHGNYFIKIGSVIGPKLVHVPLFMAVVVIVSVGSDVANLATMNAGNDQL